MFFHTTTGCCYIAACAVFASGSHMMHLEYSYTEVDITVLCISSTLLTIIIIDEHYVSAGSASDDSRV